MRTNSGNELALLTIGELAAQTRLSSRALRIYDSIGLLPPVSVDVGTGYRRYSRDQISAARRIQLLRGIGMSLNDIKELLVDDAAAAETVRTFWQQEETHHLARRELVRHVQSILRGELHTMYDVSTRKVPEQKVLTLTRRITVADLSPFIGDAITTLTDLAKNAGASSDQPFFVVFHGHVDEESDGPVEVCLPVEGPVEPSGEMTVRLEPAHQTAYTRLTKGQLQFPSVLSAYDAVHDWIASQPTLEPALPPREVYFADWSTSAEAQEVCDISWPVRPTG